MARISDLPLDLLVHIIKILRNSYRKERDTRVISTVNKAFNDACAPFIFHTYRLVLRSGRECESAFSPEYARERINTISRKGSSIRELVIIDRKTDAGIMPEEIVPDLLEALKSVTYLRVFTLFSWDSPERRIPDPLWEWLRVHPFGLTALYIIGPWLPPAEGGIIIDAYHLFLKPYSLKNRPFIDLVKSTKLTLVNPDLIAFKPGAEQRHLRSVHMGLERDFWGLDTDEESRNMLDFSALPKAKIWVDVRKKTPDLESSRFDQWRIIREVVRKIFGDDLTKYDVKRNKLEPQMYIWRHPSRVPKYQDQLDNEEADLAEFRAEESAKRKKELLDQQIERERKLEREIFLGERDPREPRKITYIDILN